MDASIVLKWVLTEPDTPAADLLLESWVAAGIEIAAPSWLACELANVLYQSVRQGLLTIAGAQARHAGAMAIVAVQPDRPADGERAIALADRLKQAASYDSQYLALAQRLGCALWTADERFARAAVADGFAVQTLGGG